MDYMLLWLRGRGIYWSINFMIAATSFFITFSLYLNSTKNSALFACMTELCKIVSRAGNCGHAIIYFFNFLRRQMLNSRELRMTEKTLLGLWTTEIKEFSINKSSKFIHKIFSLIYRRHKNNKSFSFDRHP